MVYIIKRYNYHAQYDMYMFWNMVLPYPQTNLKRCSNHPRHAAGSEPSNLRLRTNASLPVMVFIEGGGFLVP